MKTKTRWKKAIRTKVPRFAFINEFPSNVIAKLNPKLTVGFVKGFIVGFWNNECIVFHVCPHHLRKGVRFHTKNEILRFGKNRCGHHIFFRSQPPQSSSNRTRINNHNFVIVTVTVQFLWLLHKLIFQMFYGSFLRFQTYFLGCDIFVSCHASLLGHDTKIMDKLDSTWRVRHTKIWKFSLNYPGVSALLGRLQNFGEFAKTM